MKITTKKTHTYAAKLRRPASEGRPADSYEATADHARFLVSQGFAEYAKEEKPAPVKVAEKPAYQSRALDVEKPKADPETPKREYRRRDLTAEGSKE